MMLGVDFDSAFKKLFPKRELYHRKGGACSPLMAFKKLERLGLKPRMLPSNQNIFKLKQSSLIWIRWCDGSSLMHSVFYEKKTNSFWDPNYNTPLILPLRLKNLNKMKENIVALDGYVQPIMREIPPAELEYSDDYYDLY
jgi:hypothetical protein